MKTLSTTTITNKLILMESVNYFHLFNTGIEDFLTKEKIRDILLDYHQRDLFVPFKLDMIDIVGTRDVDINEKSLFQHIKEKSDTYYRRMYNLSNVLPIYDSIGNIAFLPKGDKKCMVYMDLGKGVIWLYGDCFDEHRRKEAKYILPYLLISILDGGILCPRHDDVLEMRVWVVSDGTMKEAMFTKQKKGVFEHSII